MAAREALTYNTPIRISTEAPPECRPGERGVVISANPSAETIESYTIECEDGFDVEVPAQFVAPEPQAAAA